MSAVRNRRVSSRTSGDEALSDVATAYCTGSETGWEHEGPQCRVGPWGSLAAGQSQRSYSGRSLSRHLSLILSGVSASAPPSVLISDIWLCDTMLDLVWVVGSGTVEDVGGSQFLCTLHTTDAQTAAVKRTSSQHGQTPPHDRHVDAARCDNHSLLRR